MIMVEDETCRIEFYKKKKNNKIWWVDYVDEKGRLSVSFDKKKIFSLWADYPKKFSKEEKELFDKENPYWANFFKPRCESLSKKTSTRKKKEAENDHGKRRKKAV